MKRRRRAVAAASVLCGLAAVGTVAPDGGAARGQAAMEAEVLSGLNAVRERPAAYARELLAYRSHIYDARVRDPETGEVQVLREGVGAVDEAIAVLDRRAPAPPLASSPLLARAAADLVRAQAASGRIGHFGPGGESLADRVRRYGQRRGVVAEGIAYGQPSADAVVRALVVDDGVPDRSHRRDLFDPRLRYAGVSCGSHPVYRTVCVVDYAEH